MSLVAVIASLVVLTSTCADQIAPASFGAPCSAAVDCAGLCYEGFCLTKSCNHDGLIQAGEVCDDGNTDNADSCTNQCQPSFCGDAVVRKDLDLGQPGYEECEPGYEGVFRNCRNDCLWAPRNRRVATSPRSTCLLSFTDPDGAGPFGDEPMAYCFRLSKRAGTDAVGCAAHTGQSETTRFNFAPVHLDGIVLSPGYVSATSELLCLRGGLGTFHWGDPWGRSGGEYARFSLYADALDARRQSIDVYRWCVLSGLGELNCGEYLDEKQCMISRRLSGNGANVWRFEAQGLINYASAETSVCAIDTAGAVWCRGDTQFWHEVPFFSGAVTSDSFCDAGSHEPRPGCMLCHRNTCTDCVDDSDCEQGQVCWTAFETPMLPGPQRACVPREQLAILDGCGENARAAPLPLPDPIVDLVASRRHYLGLSDEGKVYRWGAYDGDAAVAPEVVPLPEPAVQLAALPDMSCALSISGALWCWQGRAEAQRLETSEPLLEIAPGSMLGSHLCGLSVSGRLLCWGRFPEADLSCVADYLPDDWPFEIELLP